MPGRVTLHLVNSWGDMGDGQQILQLFGREVADADGLGLA